MVPRSGDVAMVQSQSKFNSDGVTPSTATPTEKSLEETSSEAVESRPECNWRVHPTTLLPILTAIDHFSVALIVPLLHQYFQASGVTSASQRELISSLFSTAQIVGAILIGILSDSGLLSQRSILLLSFGGSAQSYFMIMWAKRFEVLVCSRILVGLVKQTVTVGTSLMSQYTVKEERSKYIGRIMSSCTIGFIIGPTVGGYLYKYDIRAPALLASSLFVVNFFLAAILIPPSNENETKNSNGDMEKKKKKILPRSNSKLQKLTSFTKNLRQTIKSSPSQLLTIILSQLLFHFMIRATSYANMTSYYEDMFQIESHERGYIFSYQRCWNFTCQTFLVHHFLQYCAPRNKSDDKGREKEQQKQKHQSQNRGEYNAACIAAFGFVLATLMEYIGSRTTDSTTSSSSSYSYRIFLIIVCPILALSTATMNVSLKSLLTHVTPKESLTSVFGVLDVLTNMASVSVPFYRTCLFRFLGYVGDRYNLNDDNGSNGGEVSAVTMSGDPSSILWLMSSLVHWLFAALVFCYLLIGRDGDEDEQDEGTPDKVQDEKTKKLQ